MNQRREAHSENFSHFSARRRITILSHGCYFCRWLFGFQRPTRPGKEMPASRKIVFLVECSERLRLYGGKERKKR